MTEHSFFDPYDYNSILSNLQLAADLSTDGLTTLSKIAPRPSDAIGLGKVTAGAYIAVQAAVDFIGQPTSAAASILDSLKALADAVRCNLERSGTREILGTKGRSLRAFPAWNMAAAVGMGNLPISAQIVAGLWLLNAAVSEKKVPQEAARKVTKSGPLCDLPPQALLVLLNSDQDAAETAWPWLAQLQRAWPSMRNALMDGGGPPPAPASFNRRAQGQLFSRAHYASPAHRAGVFNHRNFSKGQLQEACRQTAKWITNDDWRGAWAVCTALTTLTVDLLPNLPLANSKADAWIACIDVEEGVIKLDVGFLAEDSAAAPVNATAVAAGLISTKPLPAALVHQLRKRLKATPDATTLGELYPEAPPLSGDQAMICLPCEITPSWSRWINSVGIYARSIGIDNLLAALITGDFGHIPRSKIHYAVAGKDEIWAACDRLFQQIGWGNAARDSGQIVGFGSRIVSKADALQRAAAFLYSKAESVRPARRDRDLARLLEFHNRYTKYVACELALLLALRQTKAYPLFADIDECADLWIAVEDKKVPGPPGSLPVALCRRAKKLIGCFRTHCFSVAARIEHLGGTGTVFHEWLLAVVNGEPVGLLCTASSLASIQRVGSHAVFGSLDPDIAIAHDAGRKWLENTLRYQGLRAGDIDAMLRHHIVGQSRSCSTSDFILLEWCERISKAIDAVADQLLGKVNSGLARR